MVGGNKMVFKYLTGHVYRNSPYETASDCGNCDGARCDSCKTRYYSSITGETQLLDSEEEVLELEAEYDILLNGIKYIGEPGFLVIDNLLYAEVYPIHQEEHKDIQIKCNESSKLYAGLLEKTLKKHSKYKECICRNKDSELCNVYGCTDSDCFYEMKNQGRKEKKWYM